MRDLLVLVAVLLSICAGASERIVASAGQTVILPCHINVIHDNPTIEWSKNGLVDGFAFLYRDGREDRLSKSPVFQNRTNLMGKPINGDVSLMISNVQLSDAGQYRCRTIQNRVKKDVMIELSVGALSDLKLTFVDGGGLTVQCNASGSFPEPEITFFDAKGKEIMAENPKSDVNSSGFFTVTRNVTVPADTRYKSITCRALQRKINKISYTEMYIPDECFKSCTVTIIIAVEATVIVCAVIAVVCKKYCQCGLKTIQAAIEQRGTEKKQTQPIQPSGTTDRNAEDYRQRNQARINALSLSLQEKEEIIRNLTKELNDLRSKQGPVVCQHGQPTIDRSPSRSSPGASKPVNLPQHQVPQDNNPKPATSTLQVELADFESESPKSGNLPKNKASKPVNLPQRQVPQDNNPKPATSTLAPSSSSADNPEQSHVFRSKSLTLPRSNRAKFERRRTLSPQTHPSNRFTVLANLREDSEPLLK